MGKRDRNPGALHVRVAGLIEAFGFESLFEACARACECDAARTRGLPRERALHRIARTLSRPTRGSFSTKGSRARTPG